MLTNETGLQPAYQTLIVKGERVTRSVAATVDKFPDTSVSTHIKLLNYNSFKNSYIINELLGQLD